MVLYIRATINVIYAGNEDAPDSLAFKDDFFNGSGPVDLKVNIIKKSGTDTIISQYIGFCKVFNEQREKYGKTLEAVEEKRRDDPNLYRTWISQRLPH